MIIVHGGIRHLEISGWTLGAPVAVHGGIRHLENVSLSFVPTA